MPSSPRAAVRRRRSNSASASPSPALRFRADDAWRCATKRAHPHQPFSPSYRDGSAPEAPQKWDVDIWRRGKRARREASPPFANTEDDDSAMSWLPSSDDSPTSVLETPGLASTPAAFNLFPSRKRTPRVARHTQGRLSLPDSHSPSSADLHRMRSTAFGDLRKSIAEGGEGFVLRMRDLERARTKNFSGRERIVDQRRSPGGIRKRPVSHYDSARRAYPVDSATEEEEEDVQIFVGESDLGGEPLTKKRAMSLGDMGLDTFSLDPQPYPSSMDESDRSSSPIDASVSGPSSYSSDDEELSNSLFKDTRFSFATTGISNPFTPALTHTLTNSTNSSLVSLPLPPPSQKPPSAPSSASRSEKAIAALTLALANGAGGVSDYGALSGLQGPALIDDCEVGSMFD
ncbi:hypothetical protein OE88DRAFT_1641005 [Heliocybe sulcata]|uniref:Uncharacterized protein n=1 Tax=Heliocybe sulcata TaxID=5364 RepID=A0A5C3NLF7_9AGAM|nr:hypothetical protein OE88DRAFT_1641005 [Heliocybe sulcata]